MRIGNMIGTMTQADLMRQSGAIIGYLIDQYDKDDHISFHTMPEKYLAQQWLAFQISGKCFMAWK